MSQIEAGTWHCVPSVRSRQQAHSMHQRMREQQMTQDLRPDQDPAVYKTQLCNFFRQGSCPRGDRCTFAHDPAELQAYDPRRRHSQQVQQPLQANDYSPREQRQDHDPARFKTTMCFFHYHGICQAGSDCTFAHHPAELRRFESSRPQAQQADQEQEPLVEPEEKLQYPDPACRKTVMCTYHQQGFCRFGNTCSFAHGSSELKAFDPARRWSQQAQAPARQTLQQYLPQTLQSEAAESSSRHSAISEAEAPAEEWPLLPSSSASTSSSAAASDISTASPRLPVPQPEPDSDTSSGDQSSSHEVAVTEALADENKNNKATRKINEARLLAAFASSGLRDSEDIPFTFTCPITMGVMNDPVTAADGHTYERQAILHWLERSNISPYTNEPFAHQYLSPNLNLRDIMATYFSATQQQQTPLQSSA